MERGEVQFGVTAFYVSKGRAEAVDLSVIIDHAGCGDLTDIETNPEMFPLISGTVSSYRTPAGMLAGCLAS